MRGDLLDQKIAMASQLHEAQACPRIVSQQRQVGRTRADRFEHLQHPPQRWQWCAARRDVVNQHRQQRGEPATGGLIQPPTGLMSKIKQQPCSLSALLEPDGVKPGAQRRQIAIAERQRGRSARRRATE